jgi:hypothetical protein
MTADPGEPVRNSEEMAEDCRDQERRSGLSELYS